MKQQKLYAELAQLVGALDRCLGPQPSTEWAARHRERIRDLIKRRLPSGSGFDSDTSIDLGRSTEDKLVLDTSFHHMNEHGSYDGWTVHQVIVTPSLASGFKLRITGRNRNDIKDYIHECFSHALDQTEAEWREPFEQRNAAVQAANTLSQPALLAAGAEGAALDTCDDD